MSSKTTKTNVNTDPVLIRLNTELNELNEKISKLEAFLEKSDCQEQVGVAQYALMTNQLVAMIPYRDILIARIKLMK